MAEIRLNLPIGLTRAEALRDILRERLQGEIVAFRYNDRTGTVNLTTRAFPAFPTVPPESDSSKIINEALDTINTMRTVNNQDREALDAREAEILRREREIGIREQPARQTITNTIKSFFSANE